MLTLALQGDENEVGCSFSVSVILESWFLIATQKIYSTLKIYFKWVYVSTH